MSFVSEGNGKPVCLTCKQLVAVMKEYEIYRHYTCTRASKYDEYNGKLLKDKVRELEQSLRIH